MTQDSVVSIVTSMMELTIKVALPVLLVALVVGLLVSVLQAATQIQEQTLAFVFKAAGLVVCIVVAGPWMLGQIVSWTQDLYSSIPTLIGG
jgi:flagellar biosynthesis protein FliQ